MPTTILSENNLVDNLLTESSSELVDALYPEGEAEPENGDFDHDEEDEPGNDDCDDYYEHQVELALALSEQAFIAKERAIEESIAFFKRLLKSHSEESQALSWTCRHYVQEAYEEHFRDRGRGLSMSDVPRSKESFRLDWDQRFLDFIRIQIWEVLKEKRLLNPWEESKAFNRTYNEIFAAISVPIYGFAAQVMKEIPKHHLGF